MARTLSRLPCAWRRGALTRLRTALLGTALFAVALFGAACARPAESCADAAPPTLAIALAAGGDRGWSLMPPSVLTELPLVRRGKDGRIMPALARSWTASADRRTWTFTLWSPLPTHGGVQMTAAHVKAHMLRRRPQTATYDPVSRDIVAIETPAPDTLVIRLARPTAAVLESLVSVNPGTAVPGPGLGTGPYRLTSSTATVAKYEAFPAFIGGAPKLPFVQASYYPSPRAAWAAFVRRDADFLYETPPQLAAQLARQPDVELHPIVAGHHYVFAFQQRAPALRDARVRRALNLAIDRNSLAQRVFAGYVSPSSGPFSPVYQAAQGAEPTWRYDLGAARADLAAAFGGPDRVLELECLTWSEIPLVAELTAALEAQLARINVRLKLVALTSGEFERRIAAGEFETAVLPVAVGATQLWPYLFWHSAAPGPPVRTNYAAADQALDELYGALDETAERAAVRRVHQIMRDDPPAAFLVPAPRIRAVRRRWRVPTDDGHFDVRDSIPQWTVDPAACGAR